AKSASAAHPLEYAPAISLVVAVALLSVFAAPVRDYFERAARQLLEPEGYIEAVLALQGE
ncbi:MAG TPA: hypothetical protein VLA73_02725, partial [Burkholderiales bacterium]|nr:hypothetical protein [Burkholderiales bacterium]